MRQPAPCCGDPAVQAEDWWIPAGHVPDRCGLLGYYEASDFDDTYSLWILDSGQFVMTVTYAGLGEQLLAHGELTRRDGVCLVRVERQFDIPGRGPLPARPIKVDGRSVTWPLLESADPGEPLKSKGEVVFEWVLPDSAGREDR